MRIAYIAHYQGPTLVGNRPCLHNLSLAVRVKVELIAELLLKNSHEIEIISQGEPDRRECRFYPSLTEMEPFHPAIPVYYASALPIRFIEGLWSGNRTVQLFKARHSVSPFDLIIIHNMKSGHIACAKYATRQLGLPVLLEYEDDLFVDVRGERESGLLARYHRTVYAKMLQQISGCMAVSPYLLTQVPPSIPKLLLRGVVSEDIVNSNHQPMASRKNWVVFSGTLEGTQGLEQMINAWNMSRLSDWELHIAGRGPIKDALEKLAGDNRSIVFHGLLNRKENARLLCMAKIGMNPQDVTQTQGNVFAFKIIEYLAAGLHVITTPRGSLEPELEAGISYIADNMSETIAAVLKKVIGNKSCDQTAQEAALKTYGPDAIAEALNRLVQETKVLAA
jgi:glycosyltransferase involved in cell wall biosynthesis